MPSSESALRCKDLVKRYGDTVAVAGLDLDVWRGECLGMLGPNGAGKTTTVEIFEGLRVPDSGLVEVLGEPYHSPRSTMRCAASCSRGPASWRCFPNLRCLRCGERSVSCWR